MKRMCASMVFSLVALLGVTLNGEAHGLFRRSCGGCEASCAQACEAAPVKYEEKKVTKYKPVMVEKEVEQVICKSVMRDEKFTYTVCTPVTKQEKRMVTMFTPVSKEVEYKYTVCTPTTVQEERLQTCFKRVDKEVEYKYTVMHRSTVEKKVKATKYECVTKMVEEVRPVCKLVRVSCVDECGRCYTKCERVTENVKCMRTVVERIPVVYDAVVCEVVCTPEIKVGKKMMCQLVPETKKVMVNVCKIMTETKVGKKMVCEMVPSTKEVMVNVCTYVTEKKEGVRTVCDLVTEKVKRKIQVCVMQPYEDTIRVAVCSSPSSTCETCHTSHSGGLFRRGCGCH